MKTKGVVAAVAALIISQSAFAVDSSILGNEPGASPTGASGHSQMGNLSLLNKATSWDELSLAISGTPLVYEGIYNQGIGVTASSEAERGGTYGAELRFKPAMSWYTFFASYDVLDVPYERPADALPRLSLNSFDIKTKTIYGGVQLFPFGRFDADAGFMEHIGLGVGYSYRRRDAAKQVPFTVATTYEAGGPFLRLIYDTHFGTKWSFEGYVEGLVYHWYNESELDTGVLDHAYKVSTKFMLSYHLASFASLGFGIMGEQQMVAFSGRGTRSQGLSAQVGAITNGPTNGEETVRTWGFPVELKIFF